MTKMSGAEILIDALIKEGVDVMFGYPGGVLIPVFDVIYKNADKIRFILTRHEQGAAHMADGYARSTGKVGVCLATSGPGATNLTTGIATAYLDSVPMVAITGQVRSNLIGSDAFQEVDMVGITRSITKHNYLINDIRDMPRIIKEAFYIASTGRPGPVHIDLPVDVSAGILENYVYPDTVEIRSYKPTTVGHSRQLKKVAEALAESKKPLIYAGNGVKQSGAWDELLELAEKSNAPVTTTLLALGTFPERHDLFIGMPGMHGTKTANYAFTECDFILSIGARFDDRVTGDVSKFATQAKIAHIDIDPSAISKIIQVEIPVVGDAKLVLQELLPLIEARGKNEWNSQIDEWKKLYNQPFTQDSATVIRPQYVVQRLSDLCPKDTFVSTEVGQNQMWAAQYYKLSFARQFLTSGGLGTMGYGLPAAIGAQAANPGRTCINIAGDGSIQMNIQELATAFVDRLPVKTFILNNEYLGMVRQWQQLFWGRRYSRTCLKQTPDCGMICEKEGKPCGRTYVPDFVKLAESYQCLGLRCSDPAKVDETIQKALAYDGPALVEFIVEKEENVYPMVPAGKPINEMLEAD